MELEKVKSQFLTAQVERKQAEIQIRVHALNQAIQTVGKLYQGECLGVRDFEESLTTISKLYTSLYLDIMLPKSQEAPLNGETASAILNPSNTK